MRKVSSKFGVLFCCSIKILPLEVLKSPISIELKKGAYYDRIFSSLATYVKVSIWSKLLYLLLKLVLENSTKNLNCS